MFDLLVVFLHFLATMASVVVVSDVLPMDQPGGWVGFGVVLTPVTLGIIGLGYDEGWGLRVAQAGRIAQLLLSAVVLAVGFVQGGQLFLFAVLAVLPTVLMFPLPGFTFLPPESLAERRLRSGTAGVRDVIAVAGLESVVMTAIGAAFVLAAGAMALGDDPTTGLVVGGFFGACGLLGFSQGLGEIARILPRWRSVSVRLARSSMALFGLALVGMPAADIDAPRLLLWASTVFGVLLLVALVMQRDAPASGRHWVASRDGLVEFSPAGTRRFAWDDVAAVRLDGWLVVVVTAPGTMPDQYALPGAAPPEPAEPGDAVEIVIDRAELAGVAPPTFVEQAQRARTDPAFRALLPTFLHPEGPDEAVLAEFQR